MVEITDAFLVEYDNLLIGRTKELSLGDFYSNVPGGANEKRALCYIRYAIEKLLLWDVTTAKRKFDRYMISSLKLEKFVYFIDFPPEVEPGDPQYILSLLYPKDVKLSKQELIYNNYRKVLTSDGKQFPRDYFIGGAGFRRYCFCLKYLLENYHPISSVEEVYNFLSSPDGAHFLRLYRLKNPAYQCGIKINDAIYQLTKNEPDGELYYCYFSFVKRMAELDGIKDVEDIDDDEDALYEEDLDSDM